MEIQVVKRNSRQEFEIVTIDVRDVLYVSVYGDVLQYQTKDATYSQISTLAEQERALRDLGFSRCERGYIAQVSAAKYYDVNNSALLFGEDPKDLRKSCPVSKPYRQGIRENTGLRQIKRSLRELLSY